MIEERPLLEIVVFIVRTGRPSDVLWMAVWMCISFQCLMRANPNRSQITQRTKRSNKPPRLRISHAASLLRFPLFLGKAKRLTSRTSQH